MHNNLFLIYVLLLLHRATAGDCSMSPWSSWGTCQKCTQKRLRLVLVAGRNCPAQHIQTRSCGPRTCIKQQKEEAHIEKYVAPYHAAVAMNHAKLAAAVTQMHTQHPAQQHKSPKVTISMRLQCKDIQDTVQSQFQFDLHRVLLKLLCPASGPTCLLSSQGSETMKVAVHVPPAGSKHASLLLVTGTFLPLSCYAVDRVRFQLVGQLRSSSLTMFNPSD